jgi:hypothetical protein
MKKRGQRRLELAALVCLLLGGIAAAATAPAELTSEQIVAEMAQHNQQRTASLSNYTGERHYHLVYKGFPAHKEAEMQVCAAFTAPGAKKFTIVSQSGSPFMINHVLKRLLETEQEVASREEQSRTALTGANYDFTLLGSDEVEGRPAYVLQVSPHQASKYLYRGKVWVDAADFALVKIEAEPARRHSMWISKTQVHHVYTKVGSFWLPAENHSITDVRLGGVANLTITYGHYEVNQERPGCAAGALARK